MQVTVTDVGVPESLETRGISIYPNPNNGQFSLEFGHMMGEEMEITIFDLQGRIIHNSELNDIYGSHVTNLNIQNASTGTYFLRIVTENEVVTKRIVKN